VLRIAIEEINAIEQWISRNQAAAAVELSGVLGLDKGITELFLSRVSYGAAPVTRDILSEQQAIADTFFELKLIPRKLNLLHAAPVDPEAAGHAIPTHVPGVPMSATDPLPEITARAWRVLCVTATAWGCPRRRGGRAPGAAFRARDRTAAAAPTRGWPPPVADQPGAGLAAVGPAGEQRVRRAASSPTPGVFA
jgi:hypothetical protein